MAEVYTPSEQELIEGSTVSDAERRRAVERIRAEVLREGTPRMVEEFTSALVDHDGKHQFGHWTADRERALRDVRINQEWFNEDCAWSDRWARTYLARRWVSAPEEAPCGDET